MNVNRWQDAPEGEVHDRVMRYVSEVESTQSDIFERFLKFACLYDPYERMGFGGTWFDAPGRELSPDRQVSDNVCASTVDTVASLISRHLPRVRFMTDDGDWSTQRMARRLEWYAEGLIKLYDIYAIAQRCFKDAAIFGTGLVKVYEDSEDICIERVLVDEIIVDEGECKSHKPRQMHQRKLVDRSVLMARFPEHVEAIEKAQEESGSGGWRWWADYRPIERDQLIVIESFQLPYGSPESEYYVPGRHTIVIDGKDLFDEEWEYNYFPYARFVWNEPTTGWYGIGLVGSVAGHQRVINKLNWQIDAQQDKISMPTIFVQRGDMKMAPQRPNRLGTIAVYNSAPPIVEVPDGVAPAQFKRLDDVKAAAFEVAGVNQMMAHSSIQPGVESAVAQRELKDTTNERFAIQEQAYERFIMDIVWLALAACKNLGRRAPEIIRKSRAGAKTIRWQDVDMKETRVQMAAASLISRTPAGRTQTVIEWAQAGVVSQDEARRLLQHPDLERAMSLYTAALEDIERCIEDILDGDLLVPEPYQNLQMGVWRMQMSYLKAEADNAPENVLEGLRQWIVQAAWILNPPMPVMAGPPPMGVTPGMPGMPPNEQLGPALSPGAMSIQPTRQIPS